MVVVVGSVWQAVKFMPQSIAEEMNRPCFTHTKRSHSVNLNLNESRNLHSRQHKNQPQMQCIVKIVVREGSRVGHGPRGRGTDTWTALMDSATAELSSRFRFASSFELCVCCCRNSSDPLDVNSLFPLGAVCERTEQWMSDTELKADGVGYWTAERSRSRWYLNAVETARLVFRTHWACSFDVQGSHTLECSS